MLTSTKVENASLNMIMTVNIGKGYSLSEANRDPDAPIDTIPIDSVFSPIKRVNYNITNARVGQKTDYEMTRTMLWKQTAEGSGHLRHDLVPQIDPTQ